MTSIVYDYKSIARAARGISRSFDWYPIKEDEPLFYSDLMGDGSYQGKPSIPTTKPKGQGLSCTEVFDALPHDQAGIAPHGIYRLRELWRGSDDGGLETEPR